MNRDDAVNTIKARYLLAGDFDEKELGREVGISIGKKLKTSNVCIYMDGCPPRLDCRGCIEVYIKKTMKEVANI